MTLKEFLNGTISESVSSRRNSIMYKGTFPTDRTDHDSIIEWLESNDFKFIGELVDEELIAMHTERCYTKGTYNSINPMTQWIKIFDGKKIVFIRTCNKSKARILCQWTDIDILIYKDVEYGEIIEYFDEAH